MEQRRHPMGHRHNPGSLALEGEPHPELDFALGEIGSETKRLARRESCAPMHVKRGISQPGRASGTGGVVSGVRGKTKKWTHLIVYAGIVCMVGEVEDLGRNLQNSLLDELVLPTQAQVEIGVVRADSGVTAGTDGTLIGGVIVTVYLASRQQVEWMSAVVRKNWSQ